MNLTTESIIIYAEIAIYLLIVLGIGVYFSRKKMQSSDYFLGGDKIPGWVLAFSERATAESAYMFLGAVGFIYLAGLSGVWLLSGMFIGIIFSWSFLAKRFYQERKKYNVYTLPDYFAVKYPEHGRTIRLLSAIIMGAFSLFYIAGQFSGTGKTLYSISGIDITLGTIVVAIIVIAYSCMGGFMSVAWTDAVQSALMLLAFIIVPTVAFIEIQQNGLSISESLASMGNGGNRWLGGLSGLALGAMLLTNFSWFFGFLGGQPQLSTRFMAIKNEKELKTAKWVAYLWTIVVYIGAFLVGIFGSVLYKQGTIADSEMILPYMVSELLPPWIAGIIFAAILAAIMSTASSQLLVVMTSVSEDIIHKTFGIKANERNILKISRITVIVSGILGIVISLLSESFVGGVVGFAWAGIGNTFSVVVLLTFFWKKTSGIGVIATIITGFFSAIIWTLSPLEAIVSARAGTFFVCLAVGIVFSLLYPDRKSKGETTV
ncbi:sodium/proline symporter [Bacilli bacterium]|uniref:sodium/proline symporter n=1 Tax=Oceanobacillus TaxID=182709 RepID=UPI000621032A|nr:sodium:proline symporter [Bacilli bacterium VT-13-104]PZD85567.1 sodium/proline symporter [Bacilli bacterium]PZD87182.1 sodium/proline symporter [Bacilli bacterium]PZD90576.1 sodium/proline symporter [Bacilli bacterium]RCO06335.1 sodium/proline symporter [Bacilli bacterium]